MQKLQQTLIAILVMFAAIGTGTLITHLGNFNENFNINKIKTEVIASNDIPATPDTSATTTAIELATPNTEQNDSKDSSIKNDKKIKIKGTTPPQTEKSDTALTIETPTPTPPEKSEKSENTEPQKPQPEAPLQPQAQPQSQPADPKEEQEENENAKKIENIKNQPKINKKIIETIQAMRTIPDLFVQLGIVSDNGKKAEKKKQQNALDIFTELIIELTSNLQDNTRALEDMLHYIYKQQGTEISHGRCITSTYFTYSDAENSCVMISRKVCKTNDIVPDKRYETIESCKADHGLLEKTSESREITAFKQQKEEYLRRLKTLQDAYKYYSVRWEELVDVARDSADFDTLSTAGNAISLYRTEQGEPEKAAAEKASTQDSTPLSPLPAASVQ